MASRPEFAPLGYSSSPLQSVKLSPASYVGIVLEIKQGIKAELKRNIGLPSLRLHCTGSSGMGYKRIEQVMGMR